MEAGIKVARNKPKGASKCFQLSVILVLLNFGSFVVPVTGYTLKTCKISMGEAICIKCSPKLTAVPQDIPSTVKGFDLSANKIVKIRYSDFKDFPLLTQLDINSNALAHIDPRSFENLVSLKKLNLNNNRLITLEDYLFYGLTNLTDLRIHKNRIKWISSTAFMSLTSLKFLDISNNKLHHVAKVPSIIQHLPNLQVLYLKSNDFNTFFSWEMTNSSLGLTSLDLSQNPFAVIRMTADVFPNLTWLNIGTSIRKEPVKWDVPKTFLSRVSSLDISGLHLMFDDMKMLLESVNSSLTILRMNEMKHYHFSALINMSCIIPTMYKLQLRHDKLIYIGHDLFKLCVNVTELDVAQNRIVNVQDGAFRTIQRLRILDLSQNRLPSVPVATRNLPSLVQLDLSKNNITVLGCLDFANLTKLTHLYLYQNSISTLQECLFKDLKQLQVLRLQNNTISKLGGAFIKFFPNLRQLRLNSNQLIAIKYGEFKGLTSLQNLSLHENHIKKFDKHCFIGLRNLTEIQLQNNQIEMEALNRGFLNDLKSLRRLDLSNNHIRYRNSSKLDSPPFSQLSQLEMLAFSVQRRRGKTYLPENILQGLTNLLFFSTRNIQLLTLPKDTFTYTPQLQTLDISSNELTDLSPEVFHPIQNLKSLFISRTNLRSLDFLINANLTNVQYIQARKNAFSVLSEEVMKSLPALAFLDLQGNSFTCDCDNAWFIQWAKKDNHTQVFDGYNFECNYPPDLKGKKLLDFDDESCSVNIDFICFVSTTCLILFFMAASFTYHFLRWQLAYAYYYFLALLVDAKNKNKQTANQYDAFISYNTHDELWVIRELMPKLEEEQGWRLCLHHRDFEPGRPIIDNITDAIYGSRKTICVISRRYLESEWCSREIQVASFRLFDEQKDVLILVFLEDIPTYELSPYYRMRRLLKKKTYLSWPRAAEHTELFWENLRQALNTGERLGDNRFLLTVVERQ